MFNKQMEDIAKVLAYCPENRKLFDIFVGQYLHLRETSEDIYRKYQFLYLVLKCIHNPAVESFSEIADYFFESQRNRFLCFLSDLAVLRLNPIDQKSYDRAAAFAKDFFGKRKMMVGENFTENYCNISVIMPTYNRGSIIRESIESVLNQEHEDFELVVVNDGGDDLVKSTIDQFADSRIRYVKISHSGLAGALNAGLQNAKGEYISYLDDDDIYYPNHLSALLSAARQKGRDFVYAKSKIVHGYRDDSGKFKPVRNAGTHTLPYSKSNLANHLGISVINVLHKRSLAQRVGFFNTELPWSMDWDFWMIMSDIHEPYFVDKWTAEYRKTLDNMTTSIWYQGVFYMHHLLIPYFTTAYGALTLYTSACLLEKDKNEIWSQRLSSYFISQDEILKAVFTTKRLLFDASFLYKALLANKYRHEYSIRKLMFQILRVCYRRLRFLGGYNF